MSLVVTIDEREAIPVRAIALLTDWKCLSPDRCAAIFSGDDFLEGFEGLKSYMFHEDGSYTEIAPRYWKNIVLRSLNACSDSIKAAQLTHETGYQQWRQESLLLLPSRAFVWRDEFEASYENEYGPQSKRALFNPTSFDPSNYTLNYNPLPWPGYDWKSVVLEGFSASISIKQKQPTLPLVPAERATIKNKLCRQDLLTPLIWKAAREAGEGATAAEVFAILRNWAGQKGTLLIGATEEGLQWLDSSDSLKILTLNALRKRLGRAANRPLSAVNGR